MNEGIKEYNSSQLPPAKLICDFLAHEINKHLPEAENKIWRAHPVWFLDGNPIVGYSKIKTGIRLLFWSGQSFNHPGLTAQGKFKASEILYTSVEQVNTQDLQAWLEKSRNTQWDYKNIVKRKGELLRLK